MFLYRSINNLQGSDVERTELDDWESLLYLLCLCATAGVGENRGQPLGNMEMLAIRSWCISAAPMVGILKTLALGSLPAFESLLIRRFNNRQPDIEYLRTLTRDIYTNLFWNPSLGGIRCKGTAFAGGMRFNPFEERVREKDMLVATLAYVLGMARQTSSSLL
ncbi:hypothetical protein DL89DRAFT_57621 [Linderina pennispora]|uniref:Uncharacterized protein n=1 Tax=Linderina pennispora TaxID=61395 RepID=A0A1Y1VRV5_9FUNG|nr:uncharacterized protein DL89DRAFT_57621 [Linderina pennispora]ORX64009.1 hypothetical protein DL89DRAFT_57621 [Linderina pennispora]